MGGYAPGMSLNSARLLREFLESSNVDRGDYSFNHIWAAVMDIESHIQVWSEMGIETEGFEDLLPDLKSHIFNRVSPDGSIHRAPTPPPSKAELGMLRWIAEKIDSTSLVIPIDKKDDVVTLLAEARRVLGEDNTLPPDLRLHIVRLLFHAESIVAEWEIAGDFAVTEAMERLFAAMKTAQAASTTPEVWETIMHRWVYPVAVASLGNVMPTAMAITQILTGS